nr:hypothetical protein [Tanacetum cinerariifolium]
MGAWRLDEGQAGVVHDQSNQRLDGQVTTDGGAYATGPTWLQATNPTPPITWAWSPAQGLSSTTDASVTARPTSSTVYTVAATAGLTNSLTKGSVKADVVASYPACTTLPVSISAPQTIALGESATLKATASLAGGALVFDGLSDLLLLPSPSVSSTSLSTTLTNTFTVEAWVNPVAPHEIDRQTSNSVDGTSGQQYLLFPAHGGGLAPGGDHAGMGISVGTNGVSVYEHAADYMPPVLVWEGELTKWTHVAVVYENRVPSLYIDGVFKKQGVSGSRAYVHPSYEVGHGSYGAYRGAVHELRFWRTARTALQIAATYNMSLVGNEADLAGCWHLDEGTGQIAHDATTGFCHCDCNRPDAPSCVDQPTLGAALTQEADLLTAPKEQVQVKTEYLDGLGRPVQTVLRQNTPQGNDLVQPITYDALGRQDKAYLPFVATSGSVAPGFYPQMLQQQYAFYHDAPIGPGFVSDGIARTGVAYSQTQFEASPLNRVLKQGAPGESWALNGGHDVSRYERPNTDDDAIAHYEAAYGTTAAAAHALRYAGNYAAGELWLVQTTDEEGHATQEFKDKQGQVVAKKVALTFNQWLTTSYVYDDFNRLREVLPPKATTLLASNGQQITADVDALIFHYRYDGRGRQVAKQVPAQT